MSTGTRRGAAVLALAGMLLALVPAAGAHALLVRTTPADGTSLARAPHTVTLSFSEGVSARLSHVTLLDTHGRAIPGLSVRASGGAALSVVLPRIPDGAYRLVWRTVATDDLHATGGSLVFGAGAPAARAVAAPSAEPKGADIVESALRGIDLAALATALGALAVLLICLPRAHALAGSDALERARRATRRISMAGSLAALATGVALVVYRGTAVGASSPGGLLDRVVLGTGFGQRSALRAAVVVALVGLLASPALRRASPGRAACATACALAAAIAFAEAGAGHAAALPSSAWLAVALMAMHVLAAAVWTGGVGTLALLGVGPLRRRPGAAIALLRAFGPLAAVSVGVLTITGLYALGREVSTPDELLRSSYGHVLLVKLALAAGVAALGALHVLRLHSRRASRLPRMGTIAAEAVLALGVLAAAGVLVASAPARLPARAVAPVPSVQASGRADDLVVDVVVSPNRPGPNFVTATVLDSIRPAPRAIASLRIRLTPPGGRTTVVTARRIGPHRYQAAGGAIDRAGAWRIGLVVARGGLPAARFDTRWIVGDGVARPAAPGVLLSDRPLGPIAVGLAAMLALVALLAIVVLGRRLRRRLPDAVLRRAGPIVALLVAAVALAAAFPSGASAATPTLRPVIVKLRPGGAAGPGISGLRAAAARDQAGLLAALATARSTGDAANIRPLWIINAIALRASDALVQQMQQRTEVQSVSGDPVVSVAPPAAAPSSVPVAPNLQTIGASELWDLGVTGVGVTVASLDTGVDMADPDLAAAFRGGTGAWFDPYGQHTTPADVNGHGTWTLGAMVGRSDTGTTVGVAPGARWIAAKVFNDSGQATESAIHSALQWALDPDGDATTADGAQVVDAPFALNAPGCDTTFEADIQALRAAGVLPVFAAGNAGPDSGTSRSPANNPGALSVGAVDGADVVASFSSRGPSACPGVAYPSVTAPGVGIATVDRFGFPVTEDGTSMAGPQTAGALALLLGAFPGIGADAQEAALRGGAVDLGTTGADDIYGAGRIDAMASYTLLSTAPPPPAPTIFLRDGFESGRLTAWTSSFGNGLRVTSGAALAGALGLEAASTRGMSFVIDGRVSGQSSLRVKVKLAARSINTSGLWGDVVAGLGPGGRQLFVVQLRTWAGGTQLRLVGRRSLLDAASAPVPLAPGAHALELVWRPAKGGATLAVDGKAGASLERVVVRPIARVLVGAFGLPVWRAGTLAFDDYESSSA